MPQAQNELLLNFSNSKKKTKKTEKREKNGSFGGIKLSPQIC